MRQRRKPVSRLQQPKPRHTLRKRRPAPATPLAQNYAVFPGNVAPRNTGSVRRPFPRRPPRPSFSTSVYPRVYRAGPPAASFTCAMRMLRRRAHRNRRTLPQALRQLHSRAPCACFVGALIGTAAHLRKPSGGFIHVHYAHASSLRSSEPPHTCANPPAASFSCAARVLRRRAHRNRRTLPQALRQLHSRAPCACFVGAPIGTAAHLRKPSGSFIHVRYAHASSPRSSEPPHTCANPPAASFTCAMRVLRRRVYRKRRLSPRLPRKPSSGFTKVRSRSPQVRFAAALIGSAVWRISRYSSFASPA